MYKTIFERNGKAHLLIHLFVCFWAASVKSVVSKNSLVHCEIQQKCMKMRAFLTSYHWFTSLPQKQYSFQKPQLCNTVQLQSKSLPAFHSLFFFFFQLHLPVQSEDDYCLIHYWKSDMGLICKLLFHSLVDWSLLSLSKIIICQWT